jgi:small subunit ribosomal protein S21|tara:strand:+ start:725 stop:985 length:261 start_codon:yes stop_codon:yes gene_type:complete
MPKIELTPRTNRNPKDKRPPREMPFEMALRKFKKAVERAGTLQKVREKEYFEKPTWKKKRKKAEAVNRSKKKQASLSPAAQPWRKK